MADLERLTHDVHNAASGTITATVEVGATSCTLATGSGLLGDELPFMMAVWDRSYSDASTAKLNSKYELVKVTAKTGSGVTVMVRGQEGTADIKWDCSGGQVWQWDCVVTAAMWREIDSELNLALDALDADDEQVYNVKSSPYSAAGDDSNDDTAEIQAAITAAAGATYNGVVYFPPGIYRVSSALSISDGITLRGSGVGSTTIRNITATTGIAISGSSLSNVTIKDLTIDSANDAGAVNGAVALDLDDCSECSFSNISITGFEKGFDLSSSSASSSYNRFDHVRITKSSGGTAGFYIRGDEADSNTFTACKVHCVGGVGFDLEEGKNNSVISCQFSGTTAASKGVALAAVLATDTLNNQFIGCRFNNLTTGIHVTESYVADTMIIGSHFDTVTARVTDSGTRTSLIDSVEGMKISNNAATPAVSFPDGELRLGADVDLTRSGANELTIADAVHITGVLTTDAGKAIVANGGITLPGGVLVADITGDLTGSVTGANGDTIALGDVQWHRDAANKWGTADAVQVDGGLTVGVDGAGGSITIDSETGSITIGDDENPVVLIRDGDDNLKIADNVNITGNLNLEGDFITSNVDVTTDLTVTGISTLNGHVTLAVTKVVTAGFRMTKFAVDLATNVLAHTGYAWYEVGAEGGGTSDHLDQISGGTAGDVIMITAKAGETITLRDDQGGTNLQLDTYAARSTILITGTAGSSTYQNIRLYFDGKDSLWHVFQGYADGI